MTDAEERYLGRVARLGCIRCLRLGYGETPAQIHQAREGEGGQQRAPNWLAIPLLDPHHTGSRGIHENRTALLPLKADEMDDLLAWTIEELNK